MNKILIVLIAVMLSIGLLGCEKSSTETQALRQSLTTISNATLVLSQHVDNLEKTVQKIQWDTFTQSLDEQSKTRVKLDPTQKSYQKVECNNGPLMVSVDSMESYLDGYKLTLQIGNPSYMTYTGFTVTTFWGPDWQTFAGTNNYRSGTFSQMAVAPTFKHRQHDRFTSSG